MDNVPNARRDTCSIITEFAVKLIRIVNNSTEMSASANTVIMDIRLPLTDLVWLEM